MIKLRLAEKKDAQGIADIYKPYVIETPITFEYEAPSAKDFEQRIEKIQSFYPYLVAVNHDILIGYAYGSIQMQRKAYQWNAELSVYVNEKFHHTGTAKALYSSLMEILSLQGIQNVYAGITSPNPKSENFHKNLGFEKLGIYHNTGYKLGRWHDVAWYEKSLDIHFSQTNAPKSIHELEKQKIIKILEKNSEMIFNIT